jgi:hypothetical protein
MACQARTGCFLKSGRSTQNRLDLRFRHDRESSYLIAGAGDEKIALMKALVYAAQSVMIA